MSDRKTYRFRPGPDAVPGQCVVQLQLADGKRHAWERRPASEDGKLPRAAEWWEVACDPESARSATEIGFEVEEAKPAAKPKKTASKDDGD